MNIVLVIAVITSLFVFIGAAEPLSARLRVPFTVLLAGIGTAIGLGATYLLDTNLTDSLNPLAKSILGLSDSSNVFLYVFLPTLLFQSTLGMSLRPMLDDWVPIFVMAVVAVIVSTLVIGQALAWTSSLPLLACLLIGATLSTTDPSAVVDIFRSIAAPGRLVRIVEGESLLNDAAAIALFGLFLTFVMQDRPDPELSTALVRFPISILGGAAAGWVAARLALWLMYHCAGYRRAQISVSIALPYLTYITTEQLLGASGVIAVVSAGMTLNLSGPARLPPAAWAYLDDVWDVLAHWAGALLFILAAFLVPRFLEDFRLDDLMLIGVVVIAALVSRSLSLFVLLPLLAKVRLSPHVERPYRIAMLWGGLRGALTLALALAVTESVSVPYETRRLVGILATGYTLYTLVVQGMSLRRVIHLLGLDTLSAKDRSLSNQVVAVTLQRVGEGLKRSVSGHAIESPILQSELSTFVRRRDEAIGAARDQDDLLMRDRVQLGLIALAAEERVAVLERRRNRHFSSRLGARSLLDADRLVEAARTNGRLGYQRAARESIARSDLDRFYQSLHNRLQISWPLANAVSARFAVIQGQRVILRDLDDFVDSRIAPIHGVRVAELLRELVDKRHKALSQALEALRLQFPGYAEELERRFVRRIALRLEECEYDGMRKDRLVGAELHAALIEDLDARRAVEDRPPILDLDLQRTELVRDFPMFQDLDEAARDRLSRDLRTRYANKGKRILQPDSTVRDINFIATGTIEVNVDGTTYRRDRGEMLGAVSVLNRTHAGVTARAVAPCTLLVLDGERFRDLIRLSGCVREAVRQNALQRGYDLRALGIVAE